MDLHVDHTLIHALRDSFVWQLLLEDATAAEQHKIASEWLTLYYGRDAFEQGLSSADILAAFWIDWDGFLLALDPAWDVAGDVMRGMEQGRTLEQAEALIRGAAAA
jgi:hypothetical protein